jgi:NitT/TauT family transport system ATP-binding protein
MTGHPAVSVRIEAKNFGKRAVLGPVSFDMQPGETVALTGPSGIGKSTLLAIITGLDDDYCGTVSVPEKIAFVFQEPVLLPWRNAVENITLTTGAKTDAARNVMVSVGLEGHELDYPRQMSLGQQRRLALARALAAQPDLLILDEPFASLDDETAQQMIELTARLVRQQSITMLVVTHSIAEAEALADRVLRLRGQPAMLS